LSRWDWCCQEATELARAAEQASSSINAGLFNSDYATYKHISPAQIPEIFAYNKPFGGTEPAFCLKEQMEDYFTSGRAKPLTIVMVTDGLPNQPQNLAEMLMEESQKIKYQGELTITVLLISNEVGEDRFRQICGLTPDSSVQNGGFVDIIPFTILQSEGIERALFDDLKEVRMCTDHRKPSTASQTALGPNYIQNQYPYTPFTAKGNGVQNYGSTKPRFHSSPFGGTAPATPSWMSGLGGGGSTSPGSLGTGFGGYNLGSNKGASSQGTSAVSSGYPPESTPTGSGGPGVINYPR
jgi:hypothetical protein